MMKALFHTLVVAAFVSVSHSVMAIEPSRAWPSLMRPNPQDCENALVSARSQRNQYDLKRANAIAADFLLWLTLDHTKIHKALTGKSKKLFSALELYYFTSGFVIMPDNESVSRFLDPTHFSKYMKVASGWDFTSTIWNFKWKEDLDYFKRQSVFLSARLGAASYNNFDRSEKLKAAKDIVFGNYLLWGHYSARAVFPRNLGRSVTLNSELYVDSPTVRFVAKNFRPLPRELVSDLRNLESKMSRPFSGSLTARLTAAEHSEAERNSLDQVFEKSQRLMEAFIVAYLPQILELRDEMMNLYLDENDMAAAILKADKQRLFLRTKIYELLQGDDSVLSYLPKKALPAPQLAVPALEAPASGSKLPSLDLKTLEADLSTWKSRTDGQVLDRARDLLPLVDRVVDSLPGEYKLSTQVTETQTLADLKLHASQLQDYFHSYSKVCNDDIHRLAQALDQLKPVMTNQIQQLNAFLNDLNGQSGPLVDLQKNEAELLLVNLEHALQVFEVRLEYQTKWLISVQNIQALLRQFRQNLISDAGQAEKDAAGFIEAVQSIIQIYLGQPAPEKQSHSGRARGIT